MRTTIKNIFLFLVLGIFQQTFVSNFSFVWQTNLNLVLIASFLVFIFHQGADQKNFGAWNGLLAGASLDLVSAFPFGVFALILAITGFAGERLRRILAAPRPLSFCLLFMVYFSIYKALFFLIFRWFPTTPFFLLKEFLSSLLLSLFVLFFHSFSFFNLRNFRMKIPKISWS